MRTSPSAGASPAAAPPPRRPGAAPLGGGVDRGGHLWRRRGGGGGPRRQQPVPRRARVQLIPPGEPAVVQSDGPTGSVQEAELTLPADLLKDLWRPDQLESLAAAYWRYLRHISLGLIRVVDRSGAPTVVLIHRSLAILRFRRPQYVTGPDFGQVTWPIESGLLVAEKGRGHLRISVRRVEAAAGDPQSEARLRVRSEVKNFYPFVRGSGRFARFGARIYAATQLRIHVVV